MQLSVSPSPTQYKLYPSSTALLLSALLNLSVAMDCLSAAITYLEVSIECVLW